jgi:HD-like signal output (HDOD) protein
MTLTESAGAPAGANRGTNAEAFEFVKLLASELSSSKIELPSFPDIAVRVQRVLADDSVTPDRVMRVIGGEPTLAARIMSMANSAAMNPTGRQIGDLKTAITRLGFDMLRSAAITFAMSQLRKAEQFKPIEKYLNNLWQRSVVVAALSFVIAKRCTRLPPDTAMLAGLLSSVGKLYILTRASKFPLLFKDTTAYNSIVSEWHANISKALLENWQISDDIIDAVHTCEDLEREIRGTSLADVLAAAHLFASFKDEPDLLELKLQEFKAKERLNLDRDLFEKILSDSATEIAALKDALGA